MDDSNWGATLVGHAFDLQDWSDALMPPYDPWVEKWEVGGTERVVLRSAGFDQLRGSTEVWEAAKLLTIRLNGALATRSRSDPVSVEGVAERRPDGSVGQHVIIAVGAARGRARLRAVSMSPPDPGPSAVQHWLDLADNDGLIEDLLVHQAAQPNWYDLYKAFEVIRKLCGGQSELEMRGWYSPSVLSNFTHTANANRHSLAHSSRENPPPNPMRIREASEIVRDMANRVLDEVLSKRRGIEI